MRQTLDKAYEYPFVCASEAGASEADGIEKKESWTAAMDQLSKEKSVIELKQMLREKGLKVGGVKKDLVKRLFM